MTKIDISKIKPGDQVQVANGDWYKVVTAGETAVWLDLRDGYPPSNTPAYLITAHKPAAAPEPVADLKTKAKQFIDANIWDGDDRSGAQGHWVQFTPDELQELVDEMLDDIGAVLPPVIKTATGEEESLTCRDWRKRVLLQHECFGWIVIEYYDLDPGDRYVELPKCCREGPCTP